MVVVQVARHTLPSFLFHELFHATTDRRTVSFTEGISASRSLSKF